MNAVLRKYTKSIEHYVPPILRLSDMHMLLEFIQDYAKSKPGTPALCDDKEGVISWAELQERVQRIAGFYIDNQVEYVGLVGDKSIDLVVTLLGVMAAQKYALLLDPRYGTKRLFDIIQREKLEHLWADSTAKDLLPILDKKVTIYPLNNKNIGQVSKPINQSNTQTEEGGVVLFTSGSTGIPKGVVIGMEDLFARMRAETSWFGLSSRSRTLIPLPLHFDVGLTQLLGTLFAGGTAVLSKLWFPKNLIESIEKYRITGTALSPMLWKSLLGYKDRSAATRAFSALDYATVSGGPLDKHSICEVISCLGTKTRFIKTYGQTEMFRVAALDAKRHPEKTLSVGQAYTDVDISIRDENACAQSTGQQGEIWARGMGRMKKYLGAANCGEEYHRTGDHGYLDKDGFLFVVGRRDDMLKILDQRVYPEDVANEIRAILGTRNIEVLSDKAPDPQLICVILRETLEQLNCTTHEIQLMLRKSLASHMAPRRIETVEDFPQTLSGKLDKVVLLQMIGVTERTILDEK